MIALSPEQRAAAIRGFWRGVELDAIARLLGVPEAAVRAALFTRIDPPAARNAA